MTKKLTKHEQQMLDKIAELTADLQRNQADFANFKRRTEEDKAGAIAFGKQQAILQLLPVIDNIERAISHLPKELASNQWAQGVAKLSTGLAKSLETLGLKRIVAVGQAFNPETMEAVQMEDGDGEHEVVVEELQAGYELNGAVIRHAMVKVGRR